jgi:antitoxin component YwqK of YwqJK toxin-antitoxin module
VKKNNLLILLLFGLVFSQTIYSQTTNITDSNGKKQGVWKKVDEKGNTKFEGTFVDDVPTGLFTYYYPNKKIKAKSVFFNNGKKTKTSLYNKDGILEAIGAYYEQKKDSIWVYYDVSGNIISQESYNKGAKDGVFKTFQKDGKITEEENFKNNVKHGAWKTFNSEGNPLMVCYYKNGEPDSNYVVYFSNKTKKVEGTYKFAQREGSWMFYNEDGSLRMQEIYTHGNLSKTTLFNGRFQSSYPSGIPKDEYSYKSGKKNGPFIEFYDKGKYVKKQKPMKEDESQELYEELEGQIIKMKGEYKQDKLFGKISYYDEKGKLEKSEEYDLQGNLIKK